LQKKFGPSSPPEADSPRQAEKGKGVFTTEYTEAQSNTEKRVDLIPGLTSEIKSILCMLEDRS
jgi:hypothetical protein